LSYGGITITTVAEEIPLPNYGSIKSRFYQKFKFRFVFFNRVDSCKLPVQLRLI